MPTQYAGRFGDDEFTDRHGRPLPAGTEFSVYIPNTGTLADLYTDRDRTAPADNPAEIQANGNAGFYAEPDDYEIEINGAPRVLITVPNDPDEVGSGGGTTDSVLLSPSTFPDPDFGSGPLDMWDLIAQSWAQATGNQPEDFNTQAEYDDMVLYAVLSLSAQGGGGGGGVTSVNGDPGPAVVLNYTQLDAIGNFAGTVHEVNLNGDVDRVTQDQFSDHLIDPVEAHMASAIGFESIGGLAAVDVQAALAELDTEKLDAAEKGAANGVAPLGGDSKINASYLPAIAITETFTVASQAAMLALTAERGDIAIRTDLNATFVLATDSPGTLADWKQLPTPTDAVLSVAGKTGVVVLVKADVGLGNVDNTADLVKAVASAAALTTARNIDGQAFDGSVNITVIAPGTHAATSKGTPIDADELPLVDTAATNVLKKLTLTNLKAFLKTYFDGLYQAAGSYLTASSTDTLTNKTMTSGTNTFRDATTSVTGVSELATIAETDTGTDAVRTVTPDGLAGSYAGTKAISLYAIEAATALTTGDGKAYFRIPASLNGMDLVTANASVLAKSTSGLPNVMISRGRQANATTAHAFVDMLSTAITIDANEFDSKDAATAVVINTSNDDVLTGDLIRVDVDGAGTGATGLFITLQFRLP